MIREQTGIGARALVDLGSVVLGAVPTGEV